MLPLRFAAVTICLFLGVSRASAAGEFTINLKAQAGTREQTVVSGKPGAQAFTAKAKEVVRFQWALVNGSAATLSNVTVHVFMDRGAIPSSAPQPSANALYESALILDFSPGGKNNGEFHMPMPEAGTYFVRAETIGAAKKLGKELSAALQVSVQ